MQSEFKDLEMFGTEMLVSFGVIFVLASSVDYVFHRWVMHRKGNRFHQSHDVEHHGHKKNEPEHMDLDSSHIVRAVLYSLPLSLPMTVFYWHSFLYAWAAVALWWCFTWGPIHRASHGEPLRWHWYVLCPWASWVIKHHQGHHKQKTKNYGTLAPWTDYVMSTVYRPKPITTKKFR